MKSTVIERDGDGLSELEQALDSMLTTAEDVPDRKVLIVIDLDFGGARMLRNALQLARLNGSVVQ